MTTTRVLAAAVGLLAILPAILWGGFLGVEIVVALAGIICLDEYARMAFPTDNKAALAWLVVGSGLLYLSALYLSDAWILPALAVVVMGSMAFVTFRPGESLQGAADRVGRFVLGIGWIGGLMAFIPLLRRLDDGMVWIFLVLVIPWSGDTGGYFAGRAFGKHKMYPKVSPKKTWEGFVGGLLMASVGVMIVRAVAQTSLTMVDCVILGVGLGAAAVVGDLSESLLKRAFDVKDSGWIMPGHGGLLDRIDSLLFVAPLLYCYAVFIKG